MNIEIKRFFERLGASYWFIPSLMAVAAVALSSAMVVLDGYAGAEWMTHVPWLYAAHPSGARTLLSSIGGSMITVAGTVFSVTIAAVVYASGQYGPRLLSNFMKDRGNQVTLGTFIATFLYCLLVLRTIRAADEADGYSFVPNMALFVAVLLALCSIAVLIFFIHHVPSKIHINSVIRDIGAGLLHDVGHRFPKTIGSPPEADLESDPRVPAVFKDRDGPPVSLLRPVTATRTGYIQTIDDDDIMDAACDHGLVLRMTYQPGDFVHVGRTLVEAWPAGAANDDAVVALRDAFSIGQDRTALQDLRFPIDELVEIAARALSPGVNDPFTAITCLDWLGAALGDLAGRTLPSPFRLDEADTLRVIAHPLSFAGFVDRAFGALAQYCAGDMLAALHYLATLGEVALACQRDVDRKLLSDCADQLLELAEAGLSGYNLERVRHQVGELRDIFGGRSSASARRNLAAMPAGAG